jgi:hypothetical protein
MFCFSCSSMSVTCPVSFNHIYFILIMQGVKGLHQNSVYISCLSYPNFMSNASYSDRVHYTSSTGWPVKTMNSLVGSIPLLLHPSWVQIFHWAFCFHVPVIYGLPSE